MKAWWIPPTLRGYKAAWLGADILAGMTLVAVAVHGQMATARLAGLPAWLGPDALLVGTPDLCPRRGEPATIGGGRLDDRATAGHGRGRRRGSRSQRLRRRD